MRGGQRDLPRFAFALHDNPIPHGYLLYRVGVGSSMSGDTQASRTCTGVAPPRPVPPAVMTIGVGTRLVGPSVFLDLLAASIPAGKPLRTWLTPLDVPTQAIRRWSVVLPHSGRVACS